MISVTVSGVHYIQVDYLNPDLGHIPLEHWDEISITPLQQVLGFDASEQLYDELHPREQLIVDLLMAGWNQTQIAKAFGLSQSTISVNQKRIRYQLANSKLRHTLELRTSDR